jgi:hypothetical protein
MRTKRSPMPEPLWREAVELAREHGVYAAAQGLRVSYESLRARAEAAGVARRAVRKAAPPLATFVEVRPAPAVAEGHMGPVVEVMGPDGQKLTVRLHGGELDLAALVQACWSGRQ